MIEGALIALVLVIVIAFLISVERAERLGGRHGRWIFDDQGEAKDSVPAPKGGLPRA